MFLHHSMTDSEILRTCDGCDSHHLKLVADRLRQRVDDLAMIERLARKGLDSLSIAGIQDWLGEIIDICKGD